MEKLVAIRLHDEKMDPPIVVSLIDRWTRFPAVRNTDIDRAHLSLAMMHKKLDEHDKALEVLKQIPSESSVWPEAELLTISILSEQLRESCKRSDGSYAFDKASQERTLQLLKRLESVVENLNTNRQVKSRAQYLMAVSLNDLKRPDEALTYLDIIRTSSPQTVESLAAAVLTIALNSELARWDDAIQTLRILNNALGDIRWYENDWLPLPRLYASLVESAQRFLDGDAGNLTSSSAIGFQLSSKMRIGYALKLRRLRD